MGFIDREGIFNIRIKACGVDVTKGKKDDDGNIIEGTAGKPMFRFEADILELYAEAPTDVAHFSLSGPGWVSYEEYGYTCTGTLMLFNSVDDFNDDTAMWHVEDIVEALGWSATSFTELNDMVGKECAVRIQEEEFQGKVRYNVVKIRPKGSTLSNTLTVADDSVLKALDKSLGKLSVAKGKKKSGGVKAAPKAPKAPKAPAEPVPAEPAAFDFAAAVNAAEGDDPMTKAWNFVQSVKGPLPDDAVVTAWTAETEALGKAGEDITAQDWVTIAQGVVEDLGIDVA